MKRLKPIFNKKVQKALDAYHDGFLDVLATIQGQDVDLAKDAAKASCCGGHNHTLEPTPSS